MCQNQSQSNSESEVTVEDKQQQQDQGKDTDSKKKRTRKNKQYEGYNIHKEKDGWIVIKIIAQANGRCKMERLSVPDLRVFAIEKLKMLMHQELWRDQ